MKVVDIDQQEFDEIIDINPIVAIEFWAQWCVPCLNFAEIFAEVASSYTEIFFGKINVDNNKRLVQNLSIKTVPTLLIIKQETIIYKESGTIPKNILVDLLDKATDIEV